MSNIQISDSSIAADTLHNNVCHEVYNNPGAEDLVINPYINYSSLSSYQNRSVRQEPIYQRQEPIYQNQQEIYGNREQPAAFGYPIYR